MQNLPAQYYLWGILFFAKPRRLGDEGMQGEKGEENFGV